MKIKFTKQVCRQIVRVINQNDEVCTNCPSYDTEQQCATCPIEWESYQLRNALNLKMVTPEIEDLI